MTITALYYKHLGGEGGMQCNAIKKQRSEQGTEQGTEDFFLSTDHSDCNHQNKRR